MAVLRRYSAVVLIALIFLAIAVATLDVSDYAKFYRCGDTAFINGLNPLVACRDYVQMPPTFWMMASLAFLPQPLDAWVWAVVILACAIGSLLIFTRLFNLTDAKSQAFLAILALSPFSLFLITFQQLSAVIFLLEAVVLWAMARNKPGIAALAIAASITKPHLTLLLAPLLITAGRKYQALAAILGGGAFAVLTWPYLGNIWNAWISATDQDGGKHTTVAIRELLPNGSDSWTILSLGVTLIPLAYVAWTTYELWKRGAWDWALVARLLPAGLLWIPYNRAYDWVLAIPAYLVLWQFEGRRWSNGMRWAVFLSWIAFPISTATFFLFNNFIATLSINPLPLVVLQLMLLRVTPGSVVIEDAPASEPSQPTIPAHKSATPISV